MTTYFGPLTKESCIYFLFVTMIFFGVLVFTLFGEVYWLFKNYKMLNLRIMTSGFLLLFNVFLAYFVNRLLYTMCSKALA